MKKITLAILAAVGTVGSMFAQPNINVLAPAFNAQTGYRLPNGTFEHKHLRGVSLIKASELSALTGTAVNTIGIYRLTGTLPANTAGNFTLWAMNTTDATYNAGLNFNTAITTMTMVYNGTLAVPNSTAAAFVYMPCTPTMTYNMGQGLYMAWAYDETTPASNTQTSQAIYAASNIGTGNGLCATAFSSVSPAPTTMTLSDFRPCFTFSAANTATNELSVIDMQHYATMPKMAPGNTITAIIRNNSIGALSNITPSFVAAGANVTLATTNIPSIAAGSTAQISFAYNPTAVGLSSVSVLLAADQNTTNNGFIGTQSITCSDVAIMPIALNPTLFTQATLGAGTGAATAYNFGMKWTPTSNCSLTGVACIVPSFANANNSGQTIHAVLMDINGNEIAVGNNISIGTGMMDNLYTFTFPNNNIPALTAGVPYLIGIGMTSIGHYPMGYYDPGYFVDGYYRTPMGGGTPQLLDYGFLSIKGVVISDDYLITASATRTSICTGEKVTVSVTGPTGATYLWTGVPTAENTKTAVVVSPTIAASAPSKTTNVTYNVSGNASGCKTNSASIVVKVDKCTGVNELDNSASIALYPNPTKNATTITGLNTNNVITVFNTVGQVILNEKATGDTHELNLSNYPAGTYLVRVTDGGNSIKTMKVIKQN